MTGLVLKNISKRFGDNDVLRDISVELAEGELLVLLGPSGCGKSTLLRLIAGLEEPDSGEIFIGQRRIDKLRPKERGVGLVFQNYALYPHMTVEKNLSFPLTIAEISSSEIKRRVREVAELLGLSDKLPSRPAQLSGGERQRVALGRALIRQPSVFLFDEPLSNLDADLRTRMRREIVSLQKQLRITTIHVTHDQSEALTMGDRIALLHQGRIAQLGTPQKLYHQPANLFVARFIGQPQINVIEAVIDGGRLQPFGQPVADNMRFSGKIIVGLRPERIELLPNGRHTGTIVSSEYVGGQYVMTLSFEKLTLTVSNCPAAFEPGAHVNFTFASEDLLYFDRATGRRLGHE
ncbi:MAG TPA: ABC transporter ATP-binding protein [Candidatus Deferrimicrobium sp.]|nr:ABC transporter ATP-binding protein [Candidatus Deferrimicrobium sp.]